MTGTTPKPKTAAKKAAAKPEPRSLYLPALPEGFEYTSITATGAKGETLAISPTADGEAELAIKGAGLDRRHVYPKMREAIAALAKAGKVMTKIVEREEELVRVREEALGL